MSGRLLLKKFRCTIVVVFKQFLGYKHKTCVIEYLIDHKFSTGHENITADLK